MVYRDRRPDGTVRLTGHSAGTSWPVNSVYISFANTNPSTFFGGTWTAIGQGRMLIGVDPTDANMDAAGDTGGSKTHTLTTAELPSHSHAAGTLTASSGGTHTHNINVRENIPASLSVPQTDRVSGAGGTSTVRNNTAIDSAANHTHGVSGSTDTAGSGTPHNNLGPYLAVYMWRRTA